MTAVLKPRKLATLGLVALLATGLAACSTSSPGTSPSGAPADVNPLEGKTLNMAVPYAPGGSYDRLARGIQNGFAGASDSTVVVLNEPGAGSLLSTNRTYATGTKELRLGLMNTVGVVAAQLAGDAAEGVNFDLAKFEWIGSFSSEPEVLVTAKNSKLAKPGALLKALQDGTELRYGATGPGDNTWIDAFLLRDVLGLNVKIVSGFSGAPDIYSAVLRGDVDFTMTSLASALTPIVAGDATPILYVGDDMKQFEEAYGILSKIKTVKDFAGEAGISEAKYTTFIEPYLALLTINRTLVAPPGTSADVVKAYRAAFDAAVSDKALVASSAKQRLYIQPKNGEDTAKIINQALDAESDFVDLLKRSFSEKN